MNIPSPRKAPRLAWIAVLAAAGLSGCAVWKVGQSAQLVRQSEPFQARPAAASGTLLVVGDSTAVGTGATSPRESLAGLIGTDHPRLAVVNRASDGAKFEDIAQQLSQSHERFDAILILGGGNDVIRFTGHEKLESAVARVAELARERSDKVIFMPCGNVGNAPFFFAPVSWVMTQRAQTLHQIVRGAAGRHGAAYVNLYKDRAADPFAQRPKELHARDGLHPSDAGYRLWYTELKSQAALGQKLGAAGA